MEQEQTGGRYINTACSIVTRDPDNGALNVGVYRGMISGKDAIAIPMVSMQHWGVHFSKYRERGVPMPVSVVYGWDPAFLLVSGAPVRHKGKLSEYEIAGGLRLEPCELVKGETNDLPVPAAAEMVIEGHISPDPSTFAEEGPFAEYTGYYGGEAAGKRPTIKVDCMAHRNDPIFRGLIEGNSPGKLSEDGWYVTTFGSAIAWKILDDAGVPGVTGVWSKQITDGTIIRVQIHKTYRGQAQQVAMVLWGSANYSGKMVIVVDDDIDITDDEAVEWALSYRVNADMGDISFFPGTVGSTLDPSVPVPQRDLNKYGGGKWCRVLIDATINWNLERQEQYGGERYPALATDIPPEYENLIEKRWKEYGI